MALQLSLQGFLAYLGDQTLFGIHFLEPSVLIFQFPKAFHQRGIYDTEFGSPNSLHPKPGTTSYKFLYRIAGNITSLYYAR